MKKGDRETTISPHCIGTFKMEICMLGFFLINYNYDVTEVCDIPLIWGMSGVGEDHVTASSHQSAFEPANAEIDKRYEQTPVIIEPLWKTHVGAGQFFRVRFLI